MTDIWFPRNFSDLIILRRQKTTYKKRHILIEFKIDIHRIFTFTKIIFSQMEARDSSELGSIVCFFGTNICRTALFVWLFFFLVNLFVLFFGMTAHLFTYFSFYPIFHQTFTIKIHMECRASLNLSTEKIEMNNLFHSLHPHPSNSRRPQTR